MAASSPEGAAPLAGPSAAVSRLRSSAAGLASMGGGSSPRPQRVSGGLLWPPALPAPPRDPRLAEVPSPEEKALPSRLDLARIATPLRQSLGSSRGALARLHDRPEPEQITPSERRPALMPLPQLPAEDVEAVPEPAVRTPKAGPSRRAGWCWQSPGSPGGSPGGESPSSLRGKSPLPLRDPQPSLSDPPGPPASAVAAPVPLVTRMQSHPAPPRSASLVAMLDLSALPSYTRGDSAGPGSVIATPRSPGDGGSVAATPRSPGATPRSPVTSPRVTIEVVCFRCCRPAAACRDAALHRSSWLRTSRVHPFKASTKRAASPAQGGSPDGRQGGSPVASRPSSRGRSRAANVAAAPMSPRLSPRGSTMRSSSAGALSPGGTAAERPRIGRPSAPAAARREA